MKRLIMILACGLFLCSCGERDYVVDLSRETETVSVTEEKGSLVIINKNSRTFHLDADCSYLANMREENRMELQMERPYELLLHGYKPCGGCAKENDPK